jgi:predicted transcriptional regulator
MKPKIDPVIIQLVADASDISLDELHKNAKLCVLLTELFETSPRSGRQQALMPKARIALSAQLAESIHRAEVYAAIKEKPEVAEDLLVQLINAKKRLDDLIARCKNALESGNSQGVK